MKSVIRKPALPTQEYYQFLKERNEPIELIFLLMTRNILRIYFTLSYHETDEFEFEINTNTPIILEAWKKGKKRSTPSLKHPLNDVDSGIIRQIFSEMAGKNL